MSYLFHGGRLLDPRRDTLVENVHVLVEDDRIKEVADRPIGAASATRVDLRGRTLMPGLIDAHIHLMLREVNIQSLDGVPLTLLAAKGSVSARAMLMRDVGNLTNTLGQFAPELLDTRYAEEMWALYEHGELSPDSELTGKFVDDTAHVDVDSIYDAIREAREEALIRQQGREAAREQDDD